MDEITVTVNWSETVFHHTTISVSRSDLTAAGYDPDSDEDVKSYVDGQYDASYIIDHGRDDYGDDFSQNSVHVTR
jgi:hypothetical protein